MSASTSSVENTEKPAIAYLTSCYPALSHTFILRELEALRAAGHTVKTISVRRPAKAAKLGPAEQREMANTLYLLPQLAWRFPLALAKLAVSRPRSLFHMVMAAIRLVLGSSIPSLRIPFYLAEAITLVAALDREGIRHIHNHFGNAAGTVAYLASFAKGFEYSLSVHGPDIFNTVDSEGLRRKIRRATFVRAISSFCLSQLRLHSDFSDWSKFHIVRCGIDPRNFSPSAAIPQNAPDSPLPHILCVGRLTPAKGQMTLLQASLELARAGHKHTLTLVGDGPHREPLEAFAREKQMTSWVTFTGGLPQEEVRAAYDKADLFVLPSFAEGIPVVLMEAMAMQIPVLSTTIAGIPELIEDGRNGFLVPPADDERLFSKLARLLQNKDLRTQFGHAGRATVEQHYNLNINGLEMAKLFA